MRSAALASLASLVLLACNRPPADPANRVPDFRLADVNAGSARWSEQVSPRDYLGRVSGWYFGHAT